MNRINPFLLRRTAAALAAALGILAITDAQAQSAVKLNSGTTSAECQYATMSVAPNGTVTVNCSGTIATNAGGGTTNPNPTPAATSFSLSSAGGSLTAGSAPSPALQIVRNGDTAGAYLVGYNVDGDACVNKGNYSVSFADGNSTPKDVTQLLMATTGTRCTVSLGQSRLPNGTYGLVNGTPSTAAYSLGTTNTNNPTPGPGGCPALPSNVQNETFGVQFAHNKWVSSPNGTTIIVAAMPRTGVGKTTGSMIYMPTPMTGTPSVGEVEYSISKCPGVIDTDYSNACNVKEFVSYTSRNWVESPSAAYPDKAAAQRYGYCWAPVSEGQWYLNARYKFNGLCADGWTSCGVLWQWN